MEPASEGHGTDGAHRVIWLRIKLAFLTAVSEIGKRWPKYTWYQKLAILVLGLYPTGTPGGLWAQLGQLLAAWLFVHVAVSFSRGKKDSNISDT